MRIARSFWGVRRFVLASLLLAFACVALLLFSPAARAQDDESEVTKPCASCHSQEAAAWEQSPHAIFDASGEGATCTNCHGDYGRGHPDNSAMTLRVDSSMCQECHTATYDQWQHSIHAGADVQCIGCHAVHSQQMRLTDDRLCTSCHRAALDDSLHSAHWQSDATCTMCHMTVEPVNEALASSDPALAALLVPDHDFVTVSSRNCLTCHREDVTSGQTAVSYEQELRAAKVASEQQARQLAAELEAARSSNWSLSIFSLANLGFGLGIGGMIGIALMIGLARLNTRRYRP